MDVEYLNTWLYTRLQLNKVLLHIISVIYNNMEYKTRTAKQLLKYSELVENQ